MAFLKYAKNIGRSTAYAIPAIVKNRIPNVAALIGQVTDKEQRDTTGGALKEINSILKEDVFGLMSKGLDSAQKELKTGKLYKTKEEETAEFSQSFGFDESMLDNSFLDDEGNSTLSGEKKAEILATGQAVAAGAADGIRAVADSFANSPAARASAQAGMATARFTRAGVGTQIAVGNAIRGAIVANAQILGEVHRFQTTQQAEFYRKQIEHNMAMSVMTSEMISRLAELKEISTVAAAASDQMMQSVTNRMSDFSQVFSDNGGFSAKGYVDVMTNRLRQAVGDGSMFKQMGTMLASGPIAQAFQMGLESLIPKNFSKQMEQFNNFVGDLGAVLNNRARNLARGLEARGNMFGSRALDFFSMDQGRSKDGPNLSNIVKNKAVAFDGYAHRSIVEIIPSYLADIHSELVSIRRERGIAEPTDRKLYDARTGRFSSEKLMRAQFERGAEASAGMHFDRVRQLIGDDGSKEEAQSIMGALRAMRDGEFNIQKGDNESFGKQYDEFAKTLERQGKLEQMQALQAARARIVGMHAKNGARGAYELQSALIKSGNAKERMYDSAETAEFGERMMFSGGLFNADNNRLIQGGLSGTGGIVGAPTAGVTPAATISSAAAEQIANLQSQLARLNNAPSMMNAIERAKLQDQINRAQNAERRNGEGGTVDDIVSRTNTVYGTGDFNNELEKGASGQSMFRDANGKVTIKSVLQAPMVAMSKAMNAFETKVSDVFFGDGTNDGKKGIFGSIKHMLMGDVDPLTGRRTGPLGRVVDYVKENALSPLRMALMGDPKNPASMDKSIIGTTKRWFSEAVTGGKNFLFGTKVEGPDGAMTRQGGLFGGVVNYFAGKSKDLKEFLLGKTGPDGLKEGGLLGGLRDKFNTLVQRVQQSLVGVVGEDGRRSGGLFGNTIQKGSDLVVSLWGKFQEVAVKPLGKALFGAVGEDGRRSGGLLGNAMQKGQDFLSKLWVDTNNFVLKPMKLALFGKGTVNEDGTVTGMGIFPQLGNVFKSSIIEPLAKGLLGEKGADGTRRGGALDVIKSSLSAALAPLKETFVGKDGIVTNIRKGLGDTWRDLKKSLFGDKTGEDKPLLQRIGDMISNGINKVGTWLQGALKPVTGWIEKGGEFLKTKVFEPFNNWLNHPQTGIISRMNNGVANLFYGKKNEEGIRKGGIFGTINDSVKKFFYGDDKTPGFVQRVIEPAKRFVLDEVWTPLKNGVTGMWNEAKEFLKTEIWAPMKGVFQPFITEAREQWRYLKEWSKGPLLDAFKSVGGIINDTFRNTLGVSLSDMMRKNVLDPIKNVLSSAKTLLMNTFKGIVKLPFDVLKGASDNLAISQIRRGVFKGTAADRERLMSKFGVQEGTVPDGQGSSLKSRLKAGSVTDVVAKGASSTGVVGDKGATSTGVSGSKRASVGPAQIGTNLANPIAVNATQSGVAENAAVQKGSQAPVVNTGINAVGTPGAPQPGTPSHSGGGQSSASNVSGSPRLKEIDIDSAVVATADNTKNIYSFVNRHLWGVGKNVERIVQHFKIQDAITGKNTGDKRASILNFIRNPIGAISDLASSVLKGASDLVQKTLKAATNMILTPLRLLGKAFNAVTKTVANVVKSIAPIANLLKDAVVNTVVASAKVLGGVLREVGKSAASLLTSFARSIPALTNALAQAGVGILKVAGQLAVGVTRVIGELVPVVMKMGATIITTAAKVAKEVVTGLARVTFDAIGSAFNTITGRNKSSAARLAKLTPVYVVGGYLAGTTGGVKSLAAAKAAFGTGGAGRVARAVAGAVIGGTTTGGVGAIVGAAAGFFSPEIAEKMASGKMTIRKSLSTARKNISNVYKTKKEELKDTRSNTSGMRSKLEAAKAQAADFIKSGKEKTKLGFDAVRERLSAAKEKLGEQKTRVRSLIASEKTAEHVQGMHTGFKRLGSMLWMVIPAIGLAIKSLSTFFLEGAFIKDIASLVAGGEGGGLLAGGEGGGLLERGKRLGKRGKNVGGSILSKGKDFAKSGIGKTVLKGGLIGAGLGVAGSVIGSGMGDSEVGKTLGGALEYAGWGATIGSVIPGVGTAVGAGLGALVGAGVSQWDNIKAGAEKMWGVMSKAAGALFNAVTFLPRKAWELTSTLAKESAYAIFGNDAKFDKDGKVIRKEKSGIIGKAWESLFGSDQKVLQDGQVLKDGGLGLFGNMKNMGLNAVSVFGKMLSGKDWSAGDLVKDTVFDGITKRVTDTLTSWKDKLISIGDSIANGFRYITEFKFIDDIKGTIANWWNGDKKDEKAEATPSSASTGGSVPAVAKDDRSFFQRLGDNVSSWADGSKSKVDSITYQTDGKGGYDKLATRAFGGPLGSGNTLVGELGPEILQRSGNVVGDVGSNEDLVKAATTRGDTVRQLLESVSKNSFHTASMLQSINAALGGKDMSSIMPTKDGVFKPQSSGFFASMFKAGKQLLGRAADAARQVGQKVSEAGAAVGTATKEVASHAKDTVGAVALNVKSGAASASSAGSVSEALNITKKTASDVGSTLRVGASNVAGAAAAGATDAASILTAPTGGSKVDIIKAAMKTAGMTDPKEQAMFLAQLDHESGGFRTMSENLRYSANGLLKTFPKYFKSMEDAKAASAGGPEAIANKVYGGRMGNVDAGDGFKYRGRGYIQLTGRDNYERAAAALGMDLVGNPDLASDPANAAQIALWYWGSRKNLSSAAKAGDVRTATKLINGGTNGLADRESKYAKYLNQMTGSGALATAMNGGMMSRAIPTLVGERQPEVLSPDGRIFKSIDSFIASNGDLSGLAMDTAVNEAVRRSSSAISGSSEAGNGVAEKIVSALNEKAAPTNEGVESLLAQILTALTSVVSNTSGIGNLANAGNTNNSVNIADNSQRHAGNVFSGRNFHPGERDTYPVPSGMSTLMQHVVSGGG